MIVGTCPLPLRHTNPLVRLLAFCMIVCLLTARLGTLTEEVLVTPIEDAIFDIAFISDAGNSQPFSLVVNKAKSQFECVIPQSQVPVQALLPAVAVKPEHVPVFSPRELTADIFIPPEGTA